MGAATERPNVSELLHARLAAAAAHCYPPAARRFRQRGEATVAFCVSGGVATNVRLDHPSGSSLLDAAATECVVPSASPYPDAANDGCFRVPVRFGE